MLAKFIPFKEAAVLIGVSYRTLENWVNGGYFEVKKDGTKVWRTYEENNFNCPLQKRGTRKGFLQPDLARYIAGQKAS